MSNEIEDSIVKAGCLSLQCSILIQILCSFGSKLERINYCAADIENSIFQINVRLWQQQKIKLLINHWLGKAFWGPGKRKYEIVDEQFKELIIKNLGFLLVTRYMTQTKAREDTQSLNVDENYFKSKFWLI